MLLHLMYILMISLLKRVINFPLGQIHTIIDFEFEQKRGTDLS